MKIFLLPLTLLSAAAIACPGDGMKDAQAPADKTPVAKSAPSTTVAAKSVTKVAAKQTAEVRKASPM
jgi:hypothetical protein